MEYFSILTSSNSFYEVLVQPLKLLLSFKNLLKVFFPCSYSSYTSSSSSFTFSTFSSFFLSFSSFYCCLAYYLSSLYFSMNLPWYLWTSVMHSLCSLYSKPAKVLWHSTQVKCHALLHLVSQWRSIWVFFNIW